MTPESIRLRLIQTLIWPHFDYCSFVFCNINALKVVGSGMLCHKNGVQIQTL
jgi:hypothetical protein